MVVMIPEVIWFGVIGIPLILLGSHLIVKHGRLIAERVGISGFFIGLTLVSIGTSIPEIFTHIISASKILKDPALSETLAGIAIGTDLGSNIIQITAIVGLIGLMGTIRTTRLFMRRDYLFMLFGILLLWLFSWTGSFLERWEGVVLILSYIGYLAYLVKSRAIHEKFHLHDGYHAWQSGVLMTIGFGAVLLSAHFILEAAVFSADYFEVSGSMIGALVIGVATALPELTTALVGLRKKANGIAVGTLIGSNITNPLLGIGLGATIASYPVESAILKIDLPFWFVISLVGWFFFRSHYRVARWQAGLLFLSYPVYLLLRLQGV